MLMVRRPQYHLKKLEGLCDASQRPVTVETRLLILTKAAQLSSHVLHLESDTNFGMPSVSYIEQSSLAAHLKFVAVLIVDTNERPR